MGYKEKTCSVCKEKFIPTSSRNHMCSDICRKQYYLSKGLNKTYVDGKYIPTGYNQKRENNNAWKYGSVYSHLAELKECELCGSKNNLLRHHRDHNRKNNVKKNIQVLCKKCHQKHHCIRDKYGRYTSSKGIV